MSHIDTCEGQCAKIVAWFNYDAEVCWQCKNRVDKKVAEDAAEKKAAEAAAQMRAAKAQAEREMRARQMPRKEFRSISVAGLEKLIRLLLSHPFFLSKEGVGLSSNDIRTYLLAGNLHPSALHPECFSQEEPIAALTYEWKLCFHDIFSYLNQNQVARCASKWGGNVPTDMTTLRIWIDVLFIDQYADVGTSLMVAQDIYKKAPFHLFLATPTIFNRAWCLFELAVRRQAEKETFSVESERAELSGGMTTRGDFFEAMQASMDKDKVQIRSKITAAFISSKRFDMEMLNFFLAAGGIRTFVTK